MMKEGVTMRVPGHQTVDIERQRMDVDDDSQ